MSTQAIATSTSIFFPVVIVIDRHWSIITRWYSILIASSITTFAVIYSLNLLMEVSIGTKPPNFQINSLSVSDLNVSDTKLAAIWNASFRIYNPNHGMELFLHRIDGIVFYKEEEALSISSIDGFNLGSREKKLVSMQFATTGYEGDQPIVEYPVLREIAKDQEHGTVRFSVRLDLLGYYKSKFFRCRSRAVVVKSYCSDLKVGVGNGHGYIQNVPRICPLVIFDN
ncbi:uncharacterized protein [Rutidosis leptorrhynchoides]|uniref:uncharacterized protein n=1 Tax=Rutidosis leptorrhynchoides TaxID=125765 RepID=UPI003A990902